MRRLRIVTGVPLSAIAIVSLAGCHSRADHSDDSSRSFSPVTRTIGAQASSSAKKATTPQVTSWPDQATRERLYPERADREHVDGVVRIAVTLDEAGRATDTRLISETPPGLGFGAAASTLAHLMTYSNPTGHIASVTFNVKFVAPPHLSRLRRKLQRLR